MKKKSINIGKKLSFTKETIALLNMEQQRMIAGGIPAVSVNAGCATRDGNTCPTRKQAGGPCWLCPITITD